MFDEEWNSDLPFDDKLKYPVTTELLNHVRAYKFYRSELDKLYFNPELRGEEYDVTEKVFVKGDGWFTQDHYEHKEMYTTADLLPEVQRLATILESLSNEEVKGAISLRACRGSIDEASKVYNVDGASFYYDDMESDYPSDTGEGIPF